MNTKNPKVDAFINRETKWKDEFIKLREIILDCDLTEELKWGKPCYTDNGKNIVIIHGFKEYCAILFPKGVLMEDPNRILIIQTEHVQSARQIRFTNLQEVEEIESVLKAYIKNAIEVERSGVKIELKQTSDYEMPEEFRFYLEEMPDLKTAFEALTPGRQRGYLFYFSQAKQTKTRTARVEKYIQKIFDGKGLND